MSYNLAGGRQRHALNVYKRVTRTNDEHETENAEVLVCTVRGDVRVEGGAMAERAGTQITSDRITVLTRNDPRIEHQMVLEWIGFSGRYIVQHINPDDTLTGIVITAEVERRDV